MLHIALGLARMALWSGQSAGPETPSAVEDSLLVERVAGSLRPGLDDGGRRPRCFTIHKSYGVGDPISPVKRAPGPGARTLKGRFKEAIHNSFGLPSPLSRALKRLHRKADRAAAHLEAIRAGEHAPSESVSLWDRPPPSLEVIEL